MAAAEAPSAGRPSASLPEGEVRVWLAGLDLEVETVERLARLLSQDERERAGRFHFRRDASRFMVSRAVLRTILGQCLGVEPNVVGFSAGQWGKPALAAPFDLTGLQFNASRSGWLGLYAVTRLGRVGVDIECRRPLPDLDDVAERMFSAHERQALRQLPPAQRPEAFFNCWTRKEAYVKAIGEGLSHPLDRFTVTLAPGASVRLEHVEGDPAEAGRWTLEALDPDPAYAAAIAVDGRPSGLVGLTWREHLA